MPSKILLVLCILCRFCIAQDSFEIKLGFGPEDLVLDTINNHNRLIISCDERRSRKKEIEGELWFVDLTDNRTQVIPRVEPFNHEFNPHGIYLLNKYDQQYVFVVNHYNNYKTSEVIRYRLVNDTLVFEHLYPYSSTINAVYAADTNHFYFSNDKFIRGKLVEWVNGGFINHGRFNFPNGIIVVDSNLYLSTSVGGNIWKFPFVGGKLGSKTKHARVKGADNLKLYKGKLITSSHPKFKRFYQHMKHSNKKSPSHIYSIDIHSEEKEMLLNDPEGKLISTASGGVIYKDKLYIGQVFEDYILVKNLK